MYLPVDTNLPPHPPPPKRFSGANDVISMFVHVLSFECCATLQAFECRRSLLWSADKLFI